MKLPQRFETPVNPSELRGWGDLPELLLSDVLRRLVPHLRSLAAFAATCRRWRGFLVASAPALILPRVPPLLLYPEPASTSSHLHPMSSCVIPRPITSPLAAFPSTLLSSSRGHLIFLDRPRGLLVLVDALTGAERRALPLPSPNSPHHYATLTSTHLLLFVSKHAFVTLPFPPPDPVPEWTHHRLPRAASFVASVVEFRGRLLGVTDRAQLLEFRLDAAAAAPDEAVQILPATGLPDAATFESWHYGPRLVAAGEQLLLVLLMTEPGGRGDTRTPVWVSKVAVHALDMAGGTRWEETATIGEYSLFVDCAGRSAVACADAGGCGAEGNRIYFASRCFWSGTFWSPHHPGWETDATNFGQWLHISDGGRSLPTWVCPRFFFEL
ncbi:hypothetical protein BAE44_0022550 [Dichanthelium oligosanthes]|uniref:KIB1-4 beta-propeller domain-containing protein n=1 Tax=Dichanthelium oligosanthes TaxID=888268 RepID=A0A1E5UUA3_9POAL|nr:hypothetical protein BAE44_0022550 [Dichanthelium oligosanthes]